MNEYTYFYYLTNEISRSRFYNRIPYYAVKKINTVIMREFKNQGVNKDYKIKVLCTNKNKVYFYYINNIYSPMRKKINKDITIVSKYETTILKINEKLYLSQ